MTRCKRLSFSHVGFSLAMSAVLPALLFATAATAADARPEPVKLTGRCVSLAGQWRFALDGDRKGVDEKWFTRRLDDSVKLPGTTDENHKGTFKDDHRTDRLSRLWYWKGPAWYQRDVIVPAAWKNKHITLLLERTKHTSVWVDDQPCGMGDSLSRAAGLRPLQSPDARPAHPQPVGGQFHPAAGARPARLQRRHADELERRYRADRAAGDRPGLAGRRAGLPGREESHRAGPGGRRQRDRRAGRG